jgi:hypothetical protein
MWLKKVTSERTDRLLLHGAILVLGFLARYSTNPFIAGSACYFVRELKELAPITPRKGRASKQHSGKRHSP